MCMDDERRETRTRAPRWVGQVATTLGAWLVAFLIVTALLSLFRAELESWPLGLRALVISGVLVAVMVNLVMPVLSAAVARWQTGGSSRRPRVRRPGLSRKA
jgi:antibiotic biosynthesis monooxygenase (ABM) superfamily enzyme